MLDEQGIPTYRTPERAVQAFMHLVSYKQNRDLLYETPRDIPVRLKMERDDAREICRRATRQDHDRSILSEAGVGA